MISLDLEMVLGTTFKWGKKGEVWRRCRRKDVYLGLQEAD